jgi:lysophospholipase L1-like esterase
MRERMMEGNKLIRDFLAKQKGTKYINIWNAMLGTDGKPIGTLFVADSLHMNKRGYAIWQRIIVPHLLK